MKNLTIEKNNAAMKNYSLLLSIIFVFVSTISLNAQITITNNDVQTANIDEEGSCLIGGNPDTDYPKAVLEVRSKGSGFTNGPILQATSSNLTRLFQVNQGDAGAGNFFIYDANDVRTVQFAGQGRFYVATPGNFGVDQKNPSVDFEIGTNGGGGIAAKPGGGMWATTSDFRSKKNIQSFTKGMETLMNIDFISYQYNGKFGTPKHEKTYVGVSAQELQKVAPEMVLQKKYNSATLEQMESKDYDASKFEEDFLMVDLSNLTYIMANAIKEQKAKIEDQQVLINKQQEQFDVLKKEIDLLKSALVNDTNIKNKSSVSISKEEQGFLGQNSPNPFSGNTKIVYTIPSYANKANIIFTDMNGVFIKTVAINHLGKGEINVNVKDLSFGSYNYSLVIDGAVYDTKKMIVN